MESGVVERVISGGFFDVQLTDAIRVCHLAPALLRQGITVREGDRVTVITEKDGVFLGEITQVRPRIEQPSPKPQRLPGLVSTQNGILKPQDQRLDRSEHPEWPTAVECAPCAGDEVYCTAGPARVLRVLGKTGNGSRLLELAVLKEPRVSFFAAASNVLIAPKTTPRKQPA